MMKNTDVNQLLLAYQDIFEPIKDIAEITPMSLIYIITELKQTDGEHWAVGEMLKRAFVFLIALEVNRKK